MAKKAARSVEVQFKNATDCDGARLEVSVPVGLPRKELIAAIDKLLKLPQVEKLRPRGCLNCLSGMDLRIRERFEQVIRLDV